MKRSNPAKPIALGGVLAALAITVMAMGSIIPVATYVCPVICMLLLQFVLRFSGTKIGWSWYGAVAILSALFAPDKEAVVVFFFIGYYPILRPWMEKRAGRWLWKAAYFNLSILTAYYLMMHLLGLDQVSRDLEDAGVFMTALLLILGNITFFLLDRLLETGWKQIKRG